MNEQYCNNCKFWSTMRCHRHAPVIMNNDVWGKFPMTYDLDWCGDWEKVKEKEHASGNQTLERPK